MEDGYFRTGDTVEYNPIADEIRILDRINNIMQIKNNFVCVMSVEDSLQKSQLVDAIFIHGSDKYEFITAVVQPNRKYL
ncbi:MAG: hypothetical protein EOM50_21430 [Erysipelotrichia bacterium]|nr:hypothetical protein [Erysipelotrichia bacterium]